MPASSDDAAAARHARIDRLSPLAREELALIIGEAALESWLCGEAWPPLLERCVDAIEEEQDQGPVAIRIVVDGSPGPS
ncbi:MAG TPA: hypothetical protein VM370_10515 [Candidatus Thermoplasmatota archaeon]|nr:hypothetical protein [Candidatus Thermoplasmatota archaeon]